MVKLVAFAHNSRNRQVSALERLTFGASVVRSHEVLAGHTNYLTWKEFR